MNCKSNASKTRTLREDELRLLGSLKFIAAPETEGLIQPGLGLFALSGGGTEYLIWHVRSTNLILGQVATGASAGLSLILVLYKVLLGKPLLFKRIVINSA